MPVVTRSATLPTLRRFRITVVAHPRNVASSTTTRLAFHPSPQQIQRGQEWIRAGVDGIFGHHSHTIHGARNIEGRPVFYSLGNYQFHHIEGREYPLAAYGLIARVDCQSNTVKNVFVHQDAAGANLLPTSAANQLQDHLDSLSDDLLGWTRLKWSRHVGPIYLSKSRKSWRSRLARNFRRALPLYIAWNLLPTTFFLRLGSLFPVVDFEQRIESLGKDLVEYSADVVV